MEELDLYISSLSIYMLPEYFNLKYRHEHSSIRVHEIIFSTVDKPKLLSQVCLKSLSYLLFVLTCIFSKLIGSFETPNYSELKNLNPLSTKYKGLFSIVLST